MKRVLVNVPFRDAYTGKLYKAGQKIELEEDRIAEIKEVNKNMISVVGNAKVKE